MKRLAAAIGVMACAAAALAMPAAQASPPRPATKVTLTGTTTLSFDDSTVARWDDLGVRLAARLPATMRKHTIVLPVGQVTKGAVRHRGGWVLVGPTSGKLIADDLVLREATGDVTATFSFLTLGQQSTLMRSSDVQTKTTPPKVKSKGRVKTTVRTTTMTGPIRLVDDSAFVLMMNGAIGAYALSPGQTLGTFTTTLVETTTEVTPKP